MIQLAYSPEWFYGKDIILDVISIVVLLLIAGFSIRSYKITENKKNLWLGIAFSILSVAFVAKIFTNFTLYYLVPVEFNLGLIKLTSQVVLSSGLLSALGSLAHRVLMLIGLYVIYAVYQEKIPTSVHLLIIYLMTTYIYFSRLSYYTFHVTALILLALIVYQYYQTYKKSEHYAVKWIAISFAIMAISQIPFIFIKALNILYVVAEVTQLIGYTILLITFIMVLRHAKKG